MIIDLPTFLEFAGYTFFVPNVIMALFFEFSDYKRFIEQTHEYKIIPSPILPSIKTIMTSWLVATVLFLVGSNYFVN